MELLIEGHGRLNVETATRMARALAPYGPMFFEEPVPPDNLDALAEVHRRSPVPIAAGERICGFFSAGPEPLRRDFGGKENGGDGRALLCQCGAA